MRTANFAFLIKLNESGRSEPNQKTIRKRTETHGERGNRDREVG